MFAWLGKCFGGGDNTGLAPAFDVIKQIGYGVGEFVTWSNLILFSSLAAEKDIVGAAHHI